jgi:hypothetical protein
MPPPDALEDWLFARGSQTVRLVREQGSHSSFHLVVYGPGTEVATHDFSDVVACMKRQAEMELQLLAAGYHLAQLCSDRRNAFGTWSGADPRRAPN